MRVEISINRIPKRSGIMRNTIAGIFQSVKQTEDAIDHLFSEGFRPENMTVFTNAKEYNPLIFPAVPVIQVSNQYNDSICEMILDIASDDMLESELVDTINDKTEKYILLLEYVDLDANMIDNLSPELNFI
jgi:hypothetical protein